jgi:hypothetical protein
MWPLYESGLVLALAAGGVRLMVLHARVRLLEGLAVTDPLTGAFNLRHPPRCIWPNAPAATGSPRATALSSVPQPDMWHYAACGTGRPLILLHGIGMSRVVWNPVLPHLTATRRAIAFDIAGLGSTPPLTGDHGGVARLVLECAA